MANDRVFIRCSQCGGHKMLLKYFPGVGLTTRDNGILEWLDAHAICSSGLGGDLGGDPRFTLFTERDWPGVTANGFNYIPAQGGSDE